MAEEEKMTIRKLMEFACTYHLDEFKELLKEHGETEGLQKPHSSEYFVGRDYIYDAVKDGTDNISKKDVFARNAKLILISKYDNGQKLDVQDSPPTDVPKDVAALREEFQAAIKALTGELKTQQETIERLEGLVEARGKTIKAQGKALADQSKKIVIADAIARAAGGEVLKLQEQVKPRIYTPPKPANPS